MRDLESTGDKMIHSLNFNLFLETGIRFSYDKKKTVIWGISLLHSHTSFSSHFELTQVPETQLKLTKAWFHSPAFP